MREQQGHGMAPVGNWFKFVQFSPCADFKGTTVSKIKGLYNV